MTDTSTDLFAKTAKKSEATDYDALLGRLIHGCSCKNCRNDTCCCDTMDEAAAAIRHLSAREARLREALNEWKCDACGGRGTYLNKGFEPASNGGEKYAERLVLCRRCDGTGQHPRARKALQENDRG